jgi:hypothetical protein
MFPKLMAGSSGRHGGDISMDATGNMHSGIRKGLGGGVELKNGKIVVENTIAIKYASHDSTDGRSMASVTGLVNDRSSTEAEESGRAVSGRKRSR